jgi:hypothetical protein
MAYLNISRSAKSDKERTNPPPTRTPRHNNAVEPQPNILVPRRSTRIDYKKLPPHFKEKENRNRNHTVDGNASENKS